jgi:ankyrin repeat protein
VALWQRELDEQMTTCVDAPDEKGRTPLMRAALCDDAAAALSMCSLLLQVTARKPGTAVAPFASQRVATRPTRRRCVATAHRGATARRWARRSPRRTWRSARASRTPRRRGTRSSCSCCSGAVRSGRAVLSTAGGCGATVPAATNANGFESK